MYPHAQTSGKFGKAMVARCWTRGHIRLHSPRERKHAQEEYLDHKEKSPQRSLWTTQGKTAELRCSGGQGSQHPDEGERRVIVHAFSSQCRKLMAERAHQESCSWLSSGSPRQFSALKYSTCTYGTPSTLSVPHKTLSIPRISSNLSKWFSLLVLQSCPSKTQILDPEPRKKMDTRPSCIIILTSFLP